MAQPLGTAANPGFAQPLPGLIEPSLMGIIRSPIGSLVRSPIAYDLARAIQTPGSFPGQPLASLGFGSLASLVEKEITDQEVTPLDRVLAGLDVPPPGVDDAVVKGLIGIGAIRGGKRPLGRLFHGVRSGKEDAEQILEFGFLKGASSEMKVPGTSVSPDPLVSFRLFTEGNNRRERARDTLLKVEPDRRFRETGDFESKRRNLTPFEYYTGDRSANEELIFMKPGTFREDELFLGRKLKTTGDPFVQLIPDESDHRQRLRQIQGSLDLVQELREEFRLTGALDPRSHDRALMLVNRPKPGIGEVLPDNEIMRLVDERVYELGTEREDILEQFVRPEVKVSRLSEAEVDKFLDFEESYRGAERYLNRFFNNQRTGETVADFKRDLPDAMNTLRSSRAYFARNIDELSAHTISGLRRAVEWPVLTLTDGDEALASGAGDRVQSAVISLRVLNDVISRDGQHGLLQDAGRGRANPEQLKMSADTVEKDIRNLVHFGAPPNFIRALRGYETALRETHAGLNVAGRALTADDIKALKGPFDRVFRALADAREHFADTVVDIAKHVPVKHNRPVTRAREMFIEMNSALGFDQFGGDALGESAKLARETSYSEEVRALEDLWKSGDQNAAQVLFGIQSGALVPEGEVESPVRRIMQDYSANLANGIRAYINRTGKRPKVYAAMLPEEFDDVLLNSLNLGNQFDFRGWSLSKAKAKKHRFGNQILVETELNPEAVLMRGDITKDELVLKSNFLTGVMHKVGTAKPRRGKLP